MCKNSRSGLICRLSSSQGLVSNHQSWPLPVQWLGNITVLERPVRITTLLSLVRSCLRGRERQYQVRAHLADLYAPNPICARCEERLRLAVQTGKLGVWELDLVNFELTCSATCVASFGRGGDRLTYEDFWKALILTTCNRADIRRSDNRRDRRLRHRIPNQLARWFDSLAVGAWATHPLVGRHADRGWWA